MTSPEAPTGAVRRRVYRLVLQYPGIHLRGVEQQLEISSALASYHLHELEKGGWLRGYDMEGYTRWFPGARSKQVPLRKKERALLGFLREEAAFRITLLLLDRGQLTHKDLVDELRLAKSTVSHHLGRLEEGGLLRRRGESIELADADLAETLLLNYEPTPDLPGRFRKLWEDMYR